MPGYDLSETVVAEATSPGRAAISVVRLTGSRAWEIALSLVPGLLARPKAQRANVVRIRCEMDSGSVSETAVLTLWEEGQSYSGERMAELSLHGNPLLVKYCVKACCKAGARLAEAGEFTWRAYMHGKLDLAQAEAVQQLISAGSSRGLQLAASALAGVPTQQVQAWIQSLTELLAAIEVIHDYASDDLDASLTASEQLTPDLLEQNLAALTAALDQALEVARRAAPLREGISIVICGPPNVGKSTLFNALLGHERAITAPEPGTTRDYITESLEAGGLKLTLVDTAGYRDVSDAVEAAGVKRAGDWARAADRVIWVTAADLDPAPIPENIRQLELLEVTTRCDLLATWPAASSDRIFVSGKTQQGIAELWSCLQLYAQQCELPQNMYAFSERQAGHIALARSELVLARQAVTAGTAFDAVAQAMYFARSALHEVFEHVDQTAVIAQVFSRFCVGK